jgi:nitronate monooxygenase
MQVCGADAVSVGTRFLASQESTVNEGYKNAIINAHMDDIVMTTKLSGTPCTIIDTPEAERMGYRQNLAERWLSKNPRTKKWFKMLVQVRGMKKLERSVLPNHYQTLWCAGKSVELIDEVLSCSDIVRNMEREYDEARGLI